MSKEREEVKYTPKEVEFYSVSVNAWYQTRMEKDKSLLTLSVAGIGLLVSLLSNESTWAMWVGVSAIISFIICSILIIHVFEKNSQHIEDVILEKDAPISLKYHDIFIKWSFILGVILSLLFSISHYLIKNEII